MRISWRVSGGPPDIVWLSTDDPLSAAAVVSGLVVTHWTNPQRSAEAFTSIVDRRQPTEFLPSGHWQLAYRPPAAHHHHCFFMPPHWPINGDPLAVITVISEPSLVQWKNCQNVGKSYSLLTLDKFSLNSQKLVQVIMIMSLWRRERAPLP